MKIVCIGDPHFKIDNIPEVNLFINRIEKLIKNERPDLCVILGDLLHDHDILHTTPLNKAYEFIDKMRKICLTYVLVGNHDQINNDVFLSSSGTHWMTSMKEWENCVIVDNTICKIIKGEKFVFVPYVPNGRFAEALSDVEWKDAKCIFAHQEFRGCKMGAFISTTGDVWDEENPFIISGHIHNKQSPQKNIFYTGSAMQNAFGESEKNIIAIIDTDLPFPNNMREVDLELPRKRIVYTTIENIASVDTLEVKEHDSVKITIKGEIAEFQAFRKTEKYKQLVKSGKKVVFKAIDNASISHTEHTCFKSPDFLKILKEMIEGDKRKEFLFQKLFQT